MLEKSICVIKKAQYLLKTKLYPWLLPFTCILCRRRSDREQDLCSHCLKDLPIIAQSCGVCANIVVGQGEYICGACLKQPPPFTAAYALFHYEQPLVSMIVGLKFSHQLAYARILGELLADKIASDWYAAKPLPDLIMPLPLHLERLRERGFNQALEIARPIASKLGLKLDYHSGLRIKNTPAQMKLSAQTRQINIKNAFKVSANLQGQRVAIVDDVMTTGATAAEFSKALLEQGAAGIDVWCCARVSPHSQ